MSIEGVDLCEATATVPVYSVGLGAVSPEDAPRHADYFELKWKKFFFLPPPFLLKKIQIENLL